MEEGIVTGGGCTLLRLAARVDGFKSKLSDDEQRVRGVACGVSAGLCVGAACRRGPRVRGRAVRALPRSLKLIAPLPSHSPPPHTHTRAQVGADIVKRALPYSLKLIASNAGDNGSVVMQRVLESEDPNFGYNAATGEFQDLMQAGIIDPAKVCVWGGGLGVGGGWASGAGRAGGRVARGGASNTPLTPPPAGDPLRARERRLCGQDLPHLQRGGHPGA